MASTIVADVAVQELTKYGFKADNEYVNYSKNLPEADRAKVVPGVKFQAELYVADSGKKYLNKVFSTLQKAQSVKKEVVHETPKAETPKAVASPKTTENKGEMTRTDWDAKDRRISRQGVIQAAVQAVAGISMDIDNIFINAEKLAKDMLDFVNEK